MNKYSLFLVFGVIVLLGAGCASSELNERGETNEDVDSGIETTLKEVDNKDINDSKDTNMSDKTDVAVSDFTTPPTEFPGVLRDEDRQNKTATIKTNKGDITVELFGDESPKAVSNFIVLSSTGFYDGIIFHRVIKDFMIQGGDPQGVGTGGPGYKFEDELGGEHTTYPPGTLAMANAGPNTNGSQFFIMHGNVPLPNAYTIFGKVTDGQDVVDAIAEVEVAPGDKPVDPVVMKTIEIK